MNSTPPDRVGVAMVIAFVLLALQTWATAQDSEIRLPLPVVKRITPLSESSVFERPEIILAGRLVERAEVWLEPDVCCLPVQFPVATRFRFGVRAGWIIRVNERSPADPDLADTSFRFQVDRTLPVAWEPRLGAQYVLFLDSPECLACIAEYVTGHPQIGFEVSEKDRVTPILKGGDLDAYAGLTLEELVKVIRTGKPK